MDFPIVAEVENMSFHGAWAACRLKGEDVQVRVLRHPFDDKNFKVFIRCASAPKIENTCAVYRGNSCRQVDLDSGLCFSSGEQTAAAGVTCPEPKP